MILLNIFFVISLACGIDIIINPDSNCRTKCSNQFNNSYNNIVDALLETSNNLDYTLLLLNGTSNIHILPDGRDLNFKTTTVFLNLPNVIEIKPLDCNDDLAILMNYQMYCINRWRNERVQITVFHTEQILAKNLRIINIHFMFANSGTIYNSGLYIPFLGANITLNSTIIRNISNGIENYFSKIFFADESIFCYNCNIYASNITLNIFESVDKIILNYSQIYNVSLWSLAKSKQIVTQNLSISNCSIFDPIFHYEILETNDLSINYSVIHSPLTTYKFEKLNSPSLKIDGFYFQNNKILSNSILNLQTDFNIINLEMSENNFISEGDVLSLRNDSITGTLKKLNFLANEYDGARLGYRTVFGCSGDNSNISISEVNLKFLKGNFRILYLAKKFFLTLSNIILFENLLNTNHLFDIESGSTIFTFNISIVKNNISGIDSTSVIFYLEEIKSKFSDIFIEKNTFLNLNLVNSVGEESEIINMLILENNINLEMYNDSTFITSSGQSYFKIKNFDFEKNIFEGRFSFPSYTLFKISSDANLIMSNISIKFNTFNSVLLMLWDLELISSFILDDTSIENNEFASIIILKDYRSTIESARINILRNIIYTIDTNSNMLNNFFSFSDSKVKFKNYAISENRYSYHSPTLFYSVDGSILEFSEGRIETESYFEFGYIFQLWQTNITINNLIIYSIQFSGQHFIAMIAEGSSAVMSNIRFTNIVVLGSGNLIEIRGNSALQVNDGIISNFRGSMEDNVFFFVIDSYLNLYQSEISQSTKLLVGFYSKVLFEDIMLSDDIIYQTLNKKISVFGSSLKLTKLSIKVQGTASMKSGFMEIISSIISINGLSYLASSTSDDSYFIKSRDSNLSLANFVFDQNEALNFNVLVISSAKNVRISSGQIKSKKSFIKIISAEEVFFDSLGIITIPSSYKNLFDLAKITSLSISNIFISPEKKISYGTVFFVAESYLINMTSISIKQVQNNMTLAKISNQDSVSKISMKKLNIKENIIYEENGVFQIIAKKPGSYLYIEESEFNNNENLGQVLQNIDNGRGGVFFVDIPGNFLISKSSFANNSASTYGGAIYAAHGIPSIDEHSLFSKNYAQQIMNHIGTPFFQLSLAPFPQNIYEYPLQPNLKIFGSIGNGLNTEFLKIYLLDRYGQVKFDDSISTLSILNPLSGLNVSQTTFSAVMGVFDLSQLFLKYHIGESATLFFQTNSDIMSGGSSNLSLSFTFRSCSIGEYPDNGVCKSCPAGTYSFAFEPKSSKECKTCEDYMTCKGGAMVSPKSGYWKLNSSSDQFIKCYPSSNCLILSDEVFSNTICDFGHQGHVCSECIEGFGKNSNFGKCYDCKKDVGIYFSILFVIACNVVFVLFVDINGELLLEGNDPGTKVQNHMQSISDGPFFSRVILRILISYIQVVAIILSIQIDWPGILIETISITKHLTITDSDIFRINCFYNRFETNIPKPYLKVILMNLMPVLFLMIVFIIKTVQIKIKKLDFKKNILVKVKGPAMIICFILQTTIIQEDLRLFQCQNIYRNDEKIFYHVYDYSIECWNTEHLNYLFFLAIPSIIFWAFLIPYGFILQYKKDRRDENKASITLFFFIGYIKDKKLWELNILARKYILIIIVTFCFSSLSIRLTLFTTFILHGILSTTKPYNRRIFTDLEKESLMLSGGLAMLGVYSEIANSTDIMWILLSIFLTFANFFYILKVIALVLKPWILSKRKHVKKLDECLTFLQRLSEKACYRFQNSSNLKVR